MRGMRVVMSEMARRESVPHFPARGIEGTLIQRGDNPKWWKVRARIARGQTPWVEGEACTRACCTALSLAMTGTRLSPSSDV